MQSKRPELAQSETVDELPKACLSEPEAVAFFERKRWPDGCACPHCGSVGVYQMKGRDGERSKRYLWRCRDCSRQFTVRTGTIFEESLLPMHKWARAFWEASSCKNGVSALELSRKLQVSYKTALFMLHRLRFAMQTDHRTPPPMTGTVEADETFVGGRIRRPNLGSKVPAHQKQKTVVFGLVQRGGHARLMQIPNVTGSVLSSQLREHVARSAHLMTDAAPQYILPGREYLAHDSVRHFDGEYVRHGNRNIHSNTVEALFGRLKKSLTGTYMAVSVKHLHRYLAQTEWLWNTKGLNDGERVEALIRKADGKRMKYAEQVGNKT